MELGLNDKQYYGFIHPQLTPMEQDEDSTVTFIKGKMWRIVMKTLELDKLDTYSAFYPAESGFLKAQFSPDPAKENRFVIDQIIEG